MTQASFDFAAVLASCVHDMKNGLCMMLQALDTLAARLPEQDQESAEEFARLHYEASRLNGDLMHLLALYRSDRQAMPLNVEEHFLDDLIEEMVQKNTLYLDMRNLSVERQLDPDLAWYFDRDLIMNLLNDVLVNAMRYCRQKILIRAEVVDGQLKILIVDDGPGYPPSMLAQSLTPLEQPELSAGRTGLGLYFAALIANAHQKRDRNGTIELANNGDLGGSVFTLTLP